MKLQVIHEGILDKNVRQLKETLRRGYPFIDDIDSFLKHIVQGCNSSTLLIDNDKWWETLVEMLQPIDENTIVQAMDHANSKMSTILLDPEQRQALMNEIQMENLFVGAFNILKKIVMFLVKAAATGVGMGVALVGGMGHGGMGHGGMGHGGKQNDTLRQKLFIACANVKTLEIFFTNLEPAAKEATRMMSQQNTTPTSTLPPAPAPLPPQSTSLSQIP